MDARPPRSVMLGVSLVLFCILATAALTQVTALVLLGVFTTIIVLWLEGYVRFARTRRFFRAIGRGIVETLRFRKMSARSLRNIMIAAGVVLALVVLNQLSISAPGEGRGLSVPAGAFSADGVGGFTSPGAGIATTFAYAVIAVVLGLGWFRLWQEVVKAGGAWRRRVYLACILTFFAMPLFFGLMMATTAPADPSDNMEFSKLLIRTVSFGMAFAFSAAVAVPFVGDVVASPSLTPSPPPAPPTYAPFSPMTRGR